MGGWIQSLLGKKCFFFAGRSTNSLCEQKPKKKTKHNILMTREAPPASKALVE
jgi:hypothetical protein